MDHNEAFFASTEPEQLDDEQTVSEPSPEKEVEQAFEEGLNQSLGLENEEQPQTVEEVKQLIAGMTEDELKEAIEKARQVDELQQRLSQLNDKAFGTIGQLKQELNALKQQGVGKPKITPEAFKALTEYYGDEELTNALVDGLSQIEFSAPQPVDIEAKVNEKLDEARKEFERKLLTIQHPDWQAIADSEDFQGWTRTLAPEAQEVLQTTWDGVTLANAFSAYKEWRNKKTEAEKKKQERLESAIQPSIGSSRQAPSADDYFNQGLKKVIAQRRI